METAAVRAKGENMMVASKAKKHERSASSHARTGPQTFFWECIVDVGVPLSNLFVLLLV
jgi:hypothetical protein